MARKLKFKFPLTWYAEAFGWQYQSVQRAKYRGWDLDDFESLLALAANSPGIKLPLKKLQALVGTPPKRPVTTLTPDHYEEAVFSLQPTYARLWTATDKAFKRFKRDPNPSTRSVWTKFRTALTALMKDLPDIDEGLRGLLEVGDVNRVTEKTIVWMGVMMDSLTRHALARREFTSISKQIAPVLAKEIDVIITKFAKDLADPNPAPKVPAKNPITDLLVVASEERACFADYLGSPTISVQRARQATYLHTLRELKTLARGVPVGAKDLTFKKSEIEVRWLRACTELLAALRAVGLRISTAPCFQKLDPVEVGLAFTDEVEQLLDRYQRGLEPPCFGVAVTPSADYVPYVSPLPPTN